MSLTNPNLVYSILHEKITGKRKNPTTSATLLDDFFKKKDKLKVLKEKMGLKLSFKNRVANEQMR
jgi:hypothetical protein